MKRSLEASIERRLLLLRVKFWLDVGFGRVSSMRPGKIAFFHIDFSYDEYFPQAVLCLWLPNINLL